METKPIFSDDRDEYLEHYGVPGMKWGVRKVRPLKGRKFSGSKTSTSKQGKLHLSDNQKKAVKIGAAIAGTALLAYGSYKLGKSVRTQQQLAQSVKRGKQLARELFESDKQNLNEALKLKGFHKNPAYGVPRVPRTFAINDLDNGKTHIVSRRNMALNDPYIKALVDDMRYQRAKMR